MCTDKSKKRRNPAVAEFLIFYAWIDWLAGIAVCPSWWPYSEFNRAPVEKLLERVKFEEARPAHTSSKNSALLFLRSSVMRHLPSFLATHSQMNRRKRSSRKAQTKNMTFRT